MKVGKVIGNIWATRKEDKLAGLKLMIVQPVSLTTRGSIRNAAGGIRCDWCRCWRAGSLCQWKLSENRFRRTGHSGRRSHRRYCG